MNHTVTDCIDFIITLDATFYRISEDIEDSLDCAVVVHEVEFNHSLLAIFLLIFEDPVRETDFFNTTFSEHCIVGCVDELIFHRAAAAVQYENFHCLFFIFEEFQCVNNRLFTLFQTDSLIAGDDDGLIDILRVATTGKIVDRSGKTLKHGTNSLHATKTLHELVGDITNLK